MNPTLDPARARTARLAVAALFFAHGATAFSVVPRFPAIKDGLGLSNTELGTAVAAMSIGGLLAGGLVGLLVHRFGSARTAVAGACGMLAALAGIGVAGSWAMLAGAYLVLGAFDATMDAAMNTHALGVQRRYGRSILQGFHGLWSAGGMAAGAVGAVMAGALVPVPVHLGIAALALGLLVAFASRGLLPAALADRPDLAASAAAPFAPDVAAVAPVAPGAAASLAAEPPAERIHPRNAPRLLRLLGPLAALGILTVVLQVPAATWSAVYLADVLGTPAGLAAAGFVVYAAAMTAGRLTSDRWVDRFGATRVVRAGAGLAGAGLAVTMAAAPLGQPALAFAGFAVLGIGSAPMFPAMIAAAGSRPGIPPGHAVAIVSWLVRIGLMIAPAVVGMAADAVGLSAAFAIPLLLALVIGLLARPMTGTACSGGRHREAIAA